MTIVILSVLPLILTAFMQVDLINVAYLTACVIYQVIMTFHFLNDAVNDVESTRKSLIKS